MCFSPGVIYFEISSVRDHDEISLLLPEDSQRIKVRHPDPDYTTPLIHAYFPEALLARRLWFESTGKMLFLRIYVLHFTYSCPPVNPTF